VQAGRYGRLGQPLRPGYSHPASQARLAVLREVAAGLGATPGQVALAWLLHQRPPVIPIPGASTVEQLAEILAAVDLRLDDDTRGRLGRAGRAGRAGADQD
jgi:aryl-alcohol dehydrogenase-like predicted oxidoreductase